MEDRIGNRRALIVRYEGYPFAIRMSKVITTLLDCGFDVDVLIPEGGEATPTYCYPDGRSLKDLVSVNTFALRDSVIFKAARYIDKSLMHKDLGFEAALTDILRRNEYGVIIVKDSHRLKPVFKTLDKLGVSNTPVVCDMYENAVEQTRDHRIRFAQPSRRALSVATLLPQRLMVMEHNLLQRCDRIFVVVDEMRSYLLEHYRINPDRISVVENVEPLWYFDSISTDQSLFGSIAPDARVVSYVGSIGAHRGIDVFFSAVSLLPEESRKKTEFVVVGVRNNQRAQIERKMADLGISETIRIVGHVSHDDAMRWIKRSQIGVIPHQDTPFIRTTIPNKLFQYMAASSLVVSSAVGPLKRIVEDSACGLVFRAGDPRDMADKLAEALADDRLIKTKGGNGRLAVEERYNWEKQSVEYSNYFNALKVGGL